jgi:hypothetical protein
MPQFRDRVPSLRMRGPLASAAGPRIIWIEQTSDSVRGWLPRRRFVLLRRLCGVLCPERSRYDPAGFSDHDLFDNAFLFAHHRFLARFPDLRYGVRISIPVADDRSTGRRSTTTVSSCN